MSKYTGDSAEPRGEELSKLHEITETSTGKFAVTLSSGDVAPFPSGTEGRYTAMPLNWHKVEFDSRAKAEAAVVADKRRVDELEQKLNRIE